MRVLYFSVMTVSPGSGGGNTVYNLLEPCPPEAEVFYATPSSYPPHWSPFPELSSRIHWFPNVSDARFYLRGARISRTIRKLNEWLARRREKALRDKIVRELTRLIGELQIDVLLICPQMMLDLVVGTELMKRTGLPTIVWFMDNYYTEDEAADYVRAMWSRATRRFVISEAMQQHFSSTYDGECEVLNNSVCFSDGYDEPAAEPDARLRIVYAGALHSYYEDSLRLTLREMQGLAGQATLDIYSHEELPHEFRSVPDAAWRHFPAVAASELGGRLQEYDVLLMLSSFKPEHRALAETSLASKTADYLAAGRCILVYGPTYAENVRYAQRYGFGEVVTSAEPGGLRAAILSLARQPKLRRELGLRAYNFGRERHNRTTNSARLWDAIRQAKI